MMGGRDMARLILLCLATALLLANAGCLHTAATWSYATATTMNPAAYDNPLSGCLVDRSFSPPRVQALIVAYKCPYEVQLGDAHNSGENSGLIVFARKRGYVLIPIADDGAPVWPFGYRGKETDWEKVKKDLPADQKTALQAYRFKPEDLLAGELAMRSKNFMRRGTATGRQTQLLLENASPYALLCIFWKISDLGYHFLLLPTSQPRPSRARDQNIREAIVWTPVSLATDAASCAVGIALMPIYVPIAIHLGLIRFD